MMRKRRLLSWIVGIMLLTVLSAHSFIVGQDKSPLKLIQKVPMPKVKGRLDHFGVDLEGRRLFVAALGEAQNTVEVIALKMGKRVFSIPGQSKPQGVFYSPDFKKLFVANGDDGTCKIFAGDTFKLIDNLPIGIDAWALLIKPRPSSGATAIARAPCVLPIFPTSVPESTSRTSTCVLWVTYSRRPAESMVHRAPTTPSPPTGTVCNKW